MIDNRKYLRIAMQDMKADISDDIGFCTAQVKDISQFGICLTELSRKLRVKGDNFMMVLSGQGHRFKLHAQGKWEEERGTARLGVEIKNAPWAWTEFVSAMEPANKDVWGTVGRY